MAEYDQISVVFKLLNKDLYNWIIKRSEEEDMSRSSFIIRSLKKIRAMEDDNGEIFTKTKKDSVK